MNSSGSRAREIVSVLRRNKIENGMNPKKLRLILEELGPTFIKLGQIASMHPDMMPREYCEELSKLCSDAAPMPYEDVIAIMEESCGCPWNQVFSWIRETPEGSASIAQVHRARLRTGEEVVVKVQRRGIAETMARDIRLLHRLIRFLPASVKNMADLNQMLDDVWTVTREEMNFVTEASNMREFSDRNKGIAFVCFPELYERYTSMNMLVMEYVDGYDINDKEALLKDGYDLREIAEKLADNYMKQIIADGFFHADPHAGNLKIRDGKIVWIDMGMMGRLTDADRQALIRGVQGIAINDYGMIEEAVLSLGEFRQPPNRKKLREGIEKLLKKYGQTGMANLNLMELLADLMEVLRENGIKMPHNLTLLVRGLTHMEGVLADLSPDINMVEIARTQIMGNLRSSSEIKKEMEKILLSLHKAQEIPTDLADALKEFRRGESRMNLDIHVSGQSARLLNHLVQSLVEGILIMALLIGASIVCTTDMQPGIFGMPVVAAIGFLLAFLLVLHMLVIRFRAGKQEKGDVS